jgi:hypothetical protein
MPGIQETPNSESFKNIFFDEAGLVRDGELFDEFERSAEDGIVRLGAHFGSYEEPIVWVSMQDAVDNNQEDQGEKRSRGLHVWSPERAIGSLAMELRDDERGFVEPLPSLDGLIVEVEDEFGSRRYLIPDNSDKEVTVASLNPLTDGEGFNTYLDAAPVSAEDAVLMRELLDKTMSTAVANL